MKTPRGARTLENILNAKWADPLVRSRRPRRPARKGGSGGTRADEGVRPAKQHSRNQSWADEGVGRGPGGPPHNRRSLRRFSGLVVQRRESFSSLLVCGTQWEHSGVRHGAFSRDSALFFSQRYRNTGLSAEAGRSPILWCTTPSWFT